MSDKTELYLISGFLGAGKTTFLKKLLAAFEGKKIGVLINEFGAVGVDGKTVERNGLSLVEINNGSIFCSCLKPSFVKTLVGFSKEDMDVLIVENSGFADPIGMHNLIEGLKGNFEKGYNYKGSVCIVDGTSFLDYVEVLSPVENQILSSNFIIINKSDLTTKEQRASVTEKIREMNPDAIIVEAVGAEVPIELLRRELRDNGINGETTNCPATRPADYTVLTDKGVYNKSEVEVFLRIISPYALRVKGFMKSEEGLMYVDAVSGHVNVRLSDKSEANAELALVFIGYDTTPFEEKLTTSWRKFLKDEPVFVRE